jgi:hypothetical protein
MTFEHQPDALPTNKATVSGAIASLVAVNAEPVVAEVWPQIAPSLLSGPAMTAFLAALAGLMAGLAVAWWVPDRAGTPNE